VRFEKVVSFFCFFREDGHELKNKKDEVQVREVVGEEVLDDKNQSLTSSQMSFPFETFLRNKTNV
jgi:hypothetical protein